MNCVYLLLIPLGLVGSQNTLDEADAHFRSEAHALSALATWHDSVYVGAVNRLYQLERSNLSLIADLATGPWPDSPLCHATGCPASSEAALRLTPNHNKVLLVDGEHEHLIWCGSVRQGACSFSPLRNIASEEPIFVPEPIAANDNVSSTFAFIGPQNYNSWGRGSVLYVGTTFSPVGGDFRHDVPAISSRNLHDLRFAEHSFSKQSLLRIDVKFRDHFLVEYVYGFNTSSHAYFLTVQKQSHAPGHEDRGYESRLGRVCISDANFDTYVETTVLCHGPPTAAQHTWARTAHFTGQELLIGFSPNASANGSSLLCSYAIHHVERVFEANIHSCLNGSMARRGLDYISGPIHDGRCPDMGSAGNVIDFCHVGLKLSGDQPLAQTAFLHFPQPIICLTAVEPPNTQASVVFLGTARGEVYYTQLERVEPVLVFQTATPEEPVLVVRVASDAAHLLVLQSQSVTRVSLARYCQRQRLDSCEACLGARFILCGWCTDTSTCTTKAQCPFKDDWLSTQQPQCISLARVQPALVSADLNRDPSIQLSTKKPVPRQFFRQSSFDCVYTHRNQSSPSQSVRAPSRVSRDGFTCPNPASLRPDWPLGEFDIQVQLQHSGATVLTAEVLFYECRYFSSCSQCLASTSCMWCPLNQTCRDLDNVASAEEAQCDVGGGDGSPTCPTIADQPSPILVPHGQLHAISVDFSYLPQLYSQQSHNPPALFCIVTIEGASMKVSAFAHGRRVACEPTVYAFNAPKPTMEAKLSIVADGNHRAPLGEVVPVEIYKCHLLAQHVEDAQDCSLCQNLKERYNCSWCVDKCIHGPCLIDQSSSECPAPVLLSVQPAHGPLEGGTVLQFEGINFDSRQLGRSRHPKQSQEFQGEIFLGPLQCSNATLKNLTRIECTTPPYGKAKSFPIRLGGVKTSLTFRYHPVSVHMAEPNRGPIAGGTLVKISGQNLNSGSKQEVWIGGVPCTPQVFQGHQDSLYCRTGSVERVQSVRGLRVEIDGAAREIPSFPFTYVLNPVVQHIKPLETYQFGGRIITFHGSGFLALSSNDIVMELERGVGDPPLTSKPCQIVSDKYLECQAPPLRRMTNESEQWKISLNSNGTPNVPEVQRNSVLRYVPNPMLFALKSEFRLYPGDALVLEGRHLAQASHKDEYQIFLDQSLCNVTTLTDTHLACQPPKVSRTDASDPPRLVTVQVTLVHQKKFSLGRVLWYLNDEGGYADRRGGTLSAYFENMASPEIVGAAGAALAILTFVSVVVILVLRHKSSEKEREYKRIQIQMDLLENNVRSECKQAFAELQTDISDVIVNLSASQIPLRSDFEYLERTLDISQSHSLGYLAFDTQETLKLQYFLTHGPFLAKLVSWCELHLGRAEQERVANCLSRILLGHMHIFSELVSVKTCETIFLGRDPSLPPHSLFSPLTGRLLWNWLAVCLHPYLKETISTCLFTLCQAVRHQIEKGPVDALTNQAKYSLSPMGLLHTVVPYSPVVCVVLERDLDEAFEAKVLDCDSISQVKRKILDAKHKNSPFSERLPAEDFELEWVCSQDARILLQDVDLTSVKRPREELQPRTATRLNTLKHYGVQDKAIVSLVHKTNKLDIASWHSESPSGQDCEHLGSPTASESSVSSRKAIPEVYLTRLLSTKAILSHYIEEFFYHSVTLPSRFPSAIKWLFDQIDLCCANRLDSAHVQNTASSLKSELLFGLFWPQLPTLARNLFDMKSDVVMEQNLQVIGQVMASLAKNPVSAYSSETSSPEALLFAKEVAQNSAKIASLLQDIQDLPSLDQDTFSGFMNDLSMYHSGLVSSQSCLVECQHTLAQITSRYLNSNSSMDGETNDFLQSLQNVM